MVLRLLVFFRILGCGSDGLTLSSIRSDRRHLGFMRIFFFACFDPAVLCR
ncbi:hypothetical protein M758_5G195000 [Ceratodon purpureus]|nr:hypothetical protein M758_5G195000 [Ceratodon purpureus]